MKVTLSIATLLAMFWTTTVGGAGPRGGRGRDNNGLRGRRDGDGPCAAYENGSDLARLCKNWCRLDCPDEMIEEEQCEEIEVDWEALAPTDQDVLPEECPDRRGGGNRGGGANRTQYEDCLELDARREVRVCTALCRHNCTGMAVEEDMPCERIESAWERITNDTIYPKCVEVEE